MLGAHGSLSASRRITIRQRHILGGCCLRVLSHRVRSLAYGTASAPSSLASVALTSRAAQRKVVCCIACCARAHATTTRARALACALSFDVLGQQRRRIAVSCSRSVRDGTPIQAVVRTCACATRALGFLAQRAIAKALNFLQVCDLCAHTHTHVQSCAEIVSVRDERAYKVKSSNNYSNVAQHTKRPDHQCNHYIHQQHE